MIDVSNTHHHKPERGRLSKIGRCTDDGSRSTLLLVQEVDGSWTFHGLGAPGVTLSKADTIALSGHPQDRKQICPACTGVAR